MQEYDVALKLLLQGSASLTMRALTGTAIAKWLDVELPKVQNLRLDLLGETVDGDLIHLELQSRLGRAGGAANCRRPEHVERLNERGRPRRPLVPHDALLLLHVGVRATDIGELCVHVPVLGLEGVVDRKST